MDEVFADPQVKHLHMAVPVDRPHPELGNLTLVGQPFAMSDIPSAIGTPAPARGEHSRAILSSFGFAEWEIDALIADKVVAAG
jgi:crotonobetainyl-CoA:carnitine CoA-transferase CaiB-like acyl-CoA transferase